MNHKLEWLEINYLVPPVINLYVKGSPGWFAQITRSGAGCWACKVDSSISPAARRFETLEAAKLWAELHVLRLMPEYIARGLVAP